MKLFYKNIICLLAVTLVCSCSDMNELSDRYLDGGEIVYAAKVDYAIAYPGKNRLKVDLFIVSQRIETVRIYWNNYAEHKDVHVGYETGIFEETLDLPQGDYLFHLVTYDKDGNQSLPEELSGVVYGATYEDRLMNRPIRTLYVENGNLIVNWGVALNGTVGMDVNYTNSDNEEVTLRIDVDEENPSIIEKYAANLQYRTVYKPVEESIDEFYTAYTPVTVEYGKIDKTTMTVTTDSYEATGQLPYGGPECTIDDDEKSYWHTQHNGGMPGFPHWLAYDLGKEYNIGKVELTSRPDYLNADFTDFILQGSNDGVTWEDYGTFKQPDIAGPQAYYPDRPMNVRHIRIYMTSGPNPYSHLNEFSAYEKVGND